MNLIRPATREEIRWVSSRLRPADYREVLTATGMNPLHALLDAPLDTTFTIRPSRTSEPACLFGLRPESKHVATVWLVGTQDLSKVSKTLVGELPRWLEAWAQRYDIYNYVDTRNTLHRRYLKKLGFEFGEVVDVRGVPFQEINYPCADPLS